MTSARKPNDWWRQLLPRHSEISTQGLPSKLILIAGSAGAIPVILDLLGSLPSQFPFPILICQHRSRLSNDGLSTIFGRVAKIPVKAASDSEVIESGVVYVAPAHSHLMVSENGGLKLIDGRRIKFLGTSAEPLFSSAATVFGRKVVAIVLTGYGSDAALGVQEVKEHGGTVIVQDEATAAVFEMPHAAIKTGCVDQVLSVSQIKSELLKLAENEVLP